MSRPRFSWEFVAPGLFLFVLPIAHTTPFRLVCLGLSIVSAVFAFGRRAPARWPARPLLIAMAFWILVCLAASIHSIEPSYSFGEFRNEVLATTVVFAIFYVLTDRIDVWRRWQAILLASFVLVAVIAIVNYERNGDWLRSSLVGDRNAYSTYVVLIVPFLLLLWLDAAGSTMRRVALSIAIVLALVSGSSTQNRNIWFGIATEFVAFATLVWFRLPAEQRRRLRMRYLVAGLIGCLVFMGSLTYVIRQKAIVSKTSTEEQARFDRDPRLEIWAYAGERIREKPWFGHGYGRGILRSDFRTHFDNILKWHGHNMAIDYVMEAGVFGGIAIVGLFAAVAWQGWVLYRRPDPEVWPLGAWALVMLLGVVLKVTTDDILVRETSLLFWSMLGMAFGYASRKSAIRQRVSPGV